MVGKVTKKINASTQITVEAEGDDLTDVLFQLNPIINAPQVCGKCSSEDITIKVKSVQEGKYQYLSYDCNSCHATKQWGEYKVPKGCFFLKRWEEPYNGQPSTEEDQENPGRKTNGK